MRESQNEKICRRWVNQSLKWSAEAKADLNWWQWKATESNQELS